MKRKHIVFMVIIFLILSLGIGLTFSYFVPVFVGTSGEDKLSLFKYNLKVNYINTSSVLINSTTSTVTKNITIENKNTVAKNYMLIFDNVVNTISGGPTLAYSYTCSSTISTCSNKSSTAAPTSNGDMSPVVSIAAGAVHTYAVTFTLTGSLTTQIFSTNINAKLINYMVTPGGYSGNTKFWASRNTISQITIEDTINIPAGTPSNLIWDMSVAGDGSIMAYKDGSNIIHIQSNGPITVSANAAGMFANMTSLTAINNANLLDTSQVTNMTQMFRDSTAIVNLDLSTWNTDKVTTVTEMFYPCSSLTTVNLKSATFKVLTSTQSMFYGTSSLKTIYLNNANFGAVTNNGGMFTLLRNNASDKGNIYVKDATTQTWIIARLTAADSRHLTNNVIVDPTCTYCP